MDARRPPLLFRRLHRRALLPRVGAQKGAPLRLKPALVLGQRWLLARRELDGLQPEELANRVANVRVEEARHARGAEVPPDAAAGPGRAPGRRM